MDDGYYILGFKILNNLTLNIKTLNHGGKIILPSGYYLYIGSAFGPGGLFARVRRHLQRNKKIRWHIDFITTKADKLNFLFVYGIKSSKDAITECDIVRKLIDEKVAKLSLRGFGATDSECSTHLLTMETNLFNFARIIKKLFNGDFLKFYPNL